MEFEIEKKFKLKFQTRIKNEQFDDLEIDEKFPKFNF